MKYSKYFGAKWRRFIKSESILASKGASQIKSENIRCDNNDNIFFQKIYSIERQRDSKYQGYALRLPNILALSHLVFKISLKALSNSLFKWLCCYNCHGNPFSKTILYNRNVYGKLCL
jgi:hypothetical protein